VELPILAGLAGNSMGQSSKMTSVLSEAETLINGDRAADYGDARENFARIAHLWSGVLGVPVSPVQVALCMMQLKVARLCHSPDHRDSWIDAAGYAGLGARLAGVEG
jgi:hypothetical protein